MIPMLTHQTAPSVNLTPEAKALRARLIDLHPDWDHRFYTDADCRDLIRRELPSLLPTYDAYPKAIQRADLFRVAAVYVHGGVYLDLDMACENHLAPLLRYGCVLAEEKTLSPDEAAALRCSERLRIANYMFASEPMHPFWIDILDEMVERSSRVVGSESDVLETTGPGLFSSVFDRVRERYEDIKLLAHPGLSCRKCGGNSCWFGSFATHLHHGTWRWQRGTA